MRTQLGLKILPQPDFTTCGPTCLHAIYRYWGDEIALNQIIDEIRHLDEGGTLDVFLACHALRRGYRATIYTYNLQVFDPSWFAAPKMDLSDRLRQQARLKDLPKLQVATEGYLEFLSLGGTIRYQDLTAGLIRGYLKRGIPILTGLSATFLYGTPREYGPDDAYDDVRGDPSGHFVVLCGYDREERTVLVADPLRPNPLSDGAQYDIGIDRVVCACLLGILTYDANLMVLQPKKIRR